MTDQIILQKQTACRSHRKNIVASAGQFHLPAIYGLREYVDDGGLISYGASIATTYRRAATYVDKISSKEQNRTSFLSICQPSSS
jgi:putative ABC transport system substrate-binding protein